MSRRLQRFAEQLRRELSERIRQDVRDPRVGTVTITGVEVAADFGSARIFVRTLGGPEELERTLEGLDAAAPFLRTELGKVLHVRRVPELRFQEDRSMEGARRIEAVLSEVLPEDDEAPEGEAEAGSTEDDTADDGAGPDTGTGADPA